MFLPSSPIVSPEISLQRSSINFLSAASQSHLPSASNPDEQSLGILSMLPKNLTIYWVVASSIAIWFLFIHSPKFIVRRKVYADFPLATHLIGAYSIYLSCMFNTLFTPSTLDGKARPWHVWIGRIGMVFGLVSFAFGLYCAWWPYRPITPPFGFSIGITIGGVAQIITQRAGYQAIQRFYVLKAKVMEIEEATGESEELETLKTQKETALRTHVYNMVALFVSACGIPAGLRIADLLPTQLGIARYIGVITIFLLMCKPFGDSYFKLPKPVTIKGDYTKL
ncbi:hypothetical protein MHU86_23379 [Fragilaria crotonensis]|nr:hypothetical protein MHU86_23379 [Fragilaria crotonensis]